MQRIYHDHKLKEYIENLFPEVQDFRCNYRERFKSNYFTNIEPGYYTHFWFKFRTNGYKKWHRFSLEVKGMCSNIPIDEVVYEKVQAYISKERARILHNEININNKNKPKIIEKRKVNKI